MKLTWPAPERNKGPILEVLGGVLPPSGVALELASGTGQHAQHFVDHLHGWTWHPSDPDPANLASIQARVDERQGDRLRPPLNLDVTAREWGAPMVNLLYCANLVHIAPWACVEGLWAGAARHVLADGQVVLYGPYRIGGQHTAPSNQSFDESLRARDESWGVRDLEEVEEVANRHGFSLSQRIPMPANNQSLVFHREPDSSGQAR